MSTESLELAIAETKKQLKGREPRRLMAWAVISLLLFFIPVVLFLTQPSDSTYHTNYAALVIIWLIVSMGLGNVIAGALFSARTTELELSLAMATSILALSKEGEATDPKGAENSDEQS
ncbi:MAG: hypothetical protein ACE5E3_05090 [Mariprofundus sp.]